MGMKLIAIANVIVIVYLITTHYEVPYKWPLLVLTGAALAALLVFKKGQPKN
jgi:hypothetical protein